jgi:hypothetical protein
MVISIGSAHQKQHISKDWTTVLAEILQVVGVLWGPGPQTGESGSLDDSQQQRPHQWIAVGARGCCHHLTWASRADRTGRDAKGADGRADMSRREGAASSRCLCMSVTRAWPGMPMCRRLGFPSPEAKKIMLWLVSRRPGGTSRRNRRRRSGIRPPCWLG